MSTISLVTYYIILYVSESLAVAISLTKIYKSAQNIYWPFVKWQRIFERVDLTYKH